MVYLRWEFSFIKDEHRFLLATDSSNKFQSTKKRNI